MVPITTLPLLQEKLCTWMGTKTCSQTKQEVSQCFIKNRLPLRSYALWLIPIWTKSIYYLGIYK